MVVLFDEPRQQLHIADIAGQCRCGLFGGRNNWGSSGYSVVLCRIHMVIASSKKSVLDLKPISASSLKNELRGSEMIAIE